MGKNRFGATAVVYLVCFAVLTASLLGGRHAQAQPPETKHDFGPVIGKIGDVVRNALLMADLVKCEFLKRSRSTPIFPENWGLKATGANRFAAELAKRTPKYDVSKVAIIDSGFYTGENPDAGEAGADARAAEAGNPEHGTHVLGTVKSKAYGVNPKVQVVPLAVETRNGRFYADVLKQLVKAIDDDGVAVISASLAVPQTPEFEALVKKGLAKGKLFAWAAGNESSAYSALTERAPAIAAEKGVFSVGALSPMALPSSFSNYGTNVKFYAPGSYIESLNAFWNPNLDGAQTNTKMSGTSMATPHFAAILASLKAAHPWATGAQLDTVLEETALVRAKVPPVYEVNPLLALRVLDEVAGKKGDFRAAVTAAAGVVKTALAAPKAPKTWDCKGGEAYLDSLLDNYFLSRGSRDASKALLDFFSLLNPKKQWVEHVLYAVPEDTAAAVKAFAGGVQLNPKELEHALRVAAGKLTDPMKLTPETVAKMGYGNLGKLLPGNEATLPRFLELCRPWLEGAESKACEGFISHGAMRFRVLLTDKLLRDKTPIPVGVMQAMRFHDVSPSDEAEYFDDFKAGKFRERQQGLIELAVRRAEAGDSASLSNVEQLVNYYMKGMPVAVRNRWIDRVLALAKSGKMLDRDGKPASAEAIETVRLRALSWAKPELLRGQEKAIRDALEYSKPVEAASDFLYALRRLEAGHGDATTLVPLYTKAIAAIAAGIRDKSIDTTMRQDGYLVETATIPFLQRPDFVKALAQSLTTPERMKDWLDTRPGDYFLRKILENVDADTGTPLLREYTVAMMRQPSTLPHFVADTLLEFDKREVGAAGELIDELRSVEPRAVDRLKRSPELMAVRGALLLRHAQDAEDYRPQIDAFLRERVPEKGEEPLWIVHPHAFSFTDDEPAIRRQGKAELTERAAALLKKDPTAVAGNFQFWRWLGSAPEDVLGRLLPTVTAQLKPMLEKALTEGTEGAWVLMERLAGEYGADEKKMRPILDIVAGLTTDAKIGRRAISLMNVLGLSAYGRKYLEKEKALMVKMADAVASEKGNLFLQYTVSPPFVEALRSKLPTVEEYRKSGELPFWVVPTLAYDPKSVDVTLRYFEMAPGESREEERLEGALEALLEDHGHLAEKIRPALTKKKAGRVKGG